jgi:hypothetical protein
MMMKHVIIIFAILISASAFAQEIDGLQLKEFSSIELKATNQDEPVSMNAKLLLSPKVSDKAYLGVKVKVHDNWHIYAYVPEGGFFIQSEIKLDLPDGVEAELIKEPKTHAYDADPQIMIYKGELLFVYELIGHLTKGDNEVGTSLYYQPCDPYACLPPNEITVKNQLLMSN